MKLIIAIVQPHRLDPVREALTEMGIFGMTVTDVKGYGRQKGHTEVYRGAEYTINYVPKLKVEVAVEADKADGVVEAITAAARTGKIGDGKIFVVPIEAAEGEEDAADASAFAPTSYSNIDEVPMPPPPSTDQAQEFYAFDEAPVLVKYVSPKYPDLARQAGIEGTVLLNVLVGDDGKVIGVTVIQSDVTPAMEKAAMEAAKQFLFKPAKQRTMPVKARVAIPIRFKLHGS